MFAHRKTEFLALLCWLRMEALSGDPNHFSILRCGILVYGLGRAFYVSTLYTYNICPEEVSFSRGDRFPGKVRRLVCVFDEYSCELTTIA